MKRLILLAAAVLSLVLLFAGCGEDEKEESASTRSYVGTQNPGDVWTWDITMNGQTGTIEAENISTGYTCSGTVELLPSLFLKITITSCSDPAQAVPFVSYALEIPDTVLLVRPDALNPNVVVAIAAGNCPQTNDTYNFVKLADNHVMDASSDMAYGVLSTTISGADISFSSALYSINGTGLGPDSDTGFTCADGIITKSGSQEQTIITPSGLFITDNGIGLGGIIGMRTPAANIDIGDLLLPGREFRGFYYENDAAGVTSKPLTATIPDPADPSHMVGYAYIDDNVENSIDTSNYGTASFGAQNLPGIINAKNADSGAAGERDIVYLINKINGKYFLYGIDLHGQSSGYGGNFLIIEQ